MAGFPRFLYLFGRDSLIFSWQLLDFNPDFAKKHLEILSNLQGKKIDPQKDEEPGKILHQYYYRKRKGYQKLPFKLPYYGSIDSTSLFLILFYFYYKKTKDVDFIKKHWKNILLSLHWIFHYGDRDNDLFLEYKRKRKTGLFHQGWKDSFNNHLKISPPVAIVEVQGYQYLALTKIAELADLLFNDKLLATSLLKRAKKLKKKFNNKFWMKKEKYFSLALDKYKRQKKSITSNPGHLLFTDICENKKIALIVKRLFQPDLFTPYGIRTLSSKDPDFNPFSYHLGSIWPHDNWIIAQGLKKLGYKKEYKKVRNSILNAFKKFGKIPEYYTYFDKKLFKIKNSCFLQSFSQGAVINFLLDKN